MCCAASSSRSSWSAVRRRPVSSAHDVRPGTKGGDMKKGKRRRGREPSATSLRGIPEVEFSKATIRRNPYAAWIAREGITVQIGRGRPKKLLEVGGTRPRSVRFPEAVWKQIEARAKAKGLTVHAVLREA